MQYELAVIIPGRNEEFMARTVQGVLENKNKTTEVIAVMDGGWADPPIENHPDLTIMMFNESRGQRVSVRSGAKLSKAKYIVKLDAHSKVSKDFDLELIKGFKELGEDVVQIPVLYNLHAFNWKCLKCGNEWYQSPTPKHCQNPGEKRGDNLSCDNTTDFERVMVWERRESRKSEAYCFDTEPHFQYHATQAKRTPGQYVETMSIQGSCFAVNRQRYLDLNMDDEEMGSWGSEGLEIALKSWLSGGRVVTNRKCWYSHLFRTQGGDFGFPFPISGSQVTHAKKTAKDIFFNNKWEQQVRPIQWLIEKFDYPRDWTPEKVKELCAEWVVDRNVDKKGIIYYTDNSLNLKLAHAVQKQLKSIGLPIVSASLKPMDFGTNIHVPLERGVLTMFIQILTALENSTADVVFFCEHDVLYHPSHFEFTPPEKEKFYYNEYFWKLDQRSGKAISYESKQVSGICVYRETAIKHYKKRIDLVQKNGFSMRMGYEPGTHNRAERVDDLTSEGWKSKFPNVDVRHDGNLSPTRWSREEFRNQKYTKGWIEGNYATISGWDANFLKSVLL